MSRRHPTIHIYSSATAKLSLYRDTDLLATASGFLVRRLGKPYLVTCLHNLIGRDFFSGKFLDKKYLSSPNRLEASAFVTTPGNRMKKIIITANLFQDGYVCFSCDTSRNGGDIAVFNLTHLENEGDELVCFPENGVNEWRELVGVDAFAIGYPSSIDIQGTPIWKKVSIASEPETRVNEHRITLLDGLTFKGMSGCPVVAIQSQGITKEGDLVFFNSIVTTIFGVYGGRYSTDKEKSGMLGFYWPFELAISLIDLPRCYADFDAES